MLSEKRLIDANALIDWLGKHTGFRGNCENCTDIDCLDCIVENCVKNFPTMDAVEVVHGRWEHDSIGFSDFWTCSACRKDFFFDDDPTVMHARFNYCPNCGAKMDGDGNE